jgi:hypothetical protein
MFEKRFWWTCTQGLESTAEELWGCRLEDELKVGDCVAD